MHSVPLLLIVEKGRYAPSQIMLVIKQENHTGLISLKATLSDKLPPLIQAYIRL
jgi:hypothetical protein